MEGEEEMRLARKAGYGDDSLRCPPLFLVSSSTSPKNTLRALAGQARKEEPLVMRPLLFRWQRRARRGGANHEGLTSTFLGGTERGQR